MSVCVGIGDLAIFLREEHLEAAEIEEFEEVYVQLNAFLSSHGLPRHEEPRSLPTLDDRSVLECFPASHLHRLRRTYAYIRAGLPLMPRTGDASTTDDAVLRGEYDGESQDSHLIHFSDCEGFYLPRELEKPLWQADGSSVGSSYALLRELKDLAPALGISLRDGILSDSEARELADHRSAHPLRLERMLWLTFFESARLSIKHASAIRVG